MVSFDKVLVWFRRDLRCFDHAALHHALRQSRCVFAAFVFDTDILGLLSRHDRRVEFILQSVAELDAELRRLGGYLIVLRGKAASEIPRLAAELGVDAVFANHDYEPGAIARDLTVALALQEDGRIWQSYKDQVIFEKNEVLSQAGTPFSVFTPYKNAWLRQLHAGDASQTSYPVETYQQHFASATTPSQVPTLLDLGFAPTNLSQLRIPTGMAGGQALFEDFTGRIGQYDRTRDFPALKGPSYLSMHLRFGTVSIRGLARHAIDVMRSTDSENGAATWLSELIWRDFYFMILYHHPHVAKRAFKPEYDEIIWESGAHADELFRAWCEGRTGYPLVDAAMHQLNQTGYMHNRLRMVTASFLVKDLGIDWRKGERYFAGQLNDYDLAANNGGWQWAASSGCDAQPYFRIFNPVTQSEKFDPTGKFIRRYLPQLGAMPDKFIHAPWRASTTDLRALGITSGVDFPEPIVSHEEARRRTLERYAVVKKARGPSAE